MKKSALSISVIIAMLFMLLPVFSQPAPSADLQGWVHQISGTREDLIDVNALDANTAWAVGWGGAILKTTDGGAHWDAQNSGLPTRDLQGISAVNEDVAWVVGHSGTILTTTDGGATWNTPPVAPPGLATTNLKGVHAFSALKMWAAGASGTVIRTEDGGNNWTTQTTPATEDLFAISAFDENNAWAVGNEGALIHTSNGGANWESQDATDEKLRGVHALSDTVAWACGFGEVWKTNDSGATWNKQPIPTDDILYDIYAVNNNVAWSVGYDDFVLEEGIILKTSTDGADWHFQYGSTNNLHGVSAVNENIAWAVGKNGEILKTTNGGEWYRTWYLAEGATLGGFETWVLVQNPGTQPADVDITYMTDAGAVDGPNFQLPAQSRVTVNVADTVQTFKVSTYVSSSAPVFAERAMYWGNRTGGHDSIGTAAPAMTWYLAEGATLGDFETWVLVQNPGADAANVDLTYMTEQGEVDGPNFVLPPQSRESIPVNATVQTYKVSTLVVSDRPVIAERSMYWGNRIGGHDSIGVNAPAPEWYLAEGATLGGFETWVLVQNPGAQASYVTLTFMTENGETPGPTFHLAPRSRESINVGDYVQTYKVSTLVTGTEPVIAERAMYWGNRIGGHDSIGVTSPQDTWYLAEGATLGGFETWVLVQNPGDIDSTVTITYMTDKGEVTGPQFSLAAHSRESVFVGNSVQNYNVSTTVTASSPVIAERAMYWGNRIGGHDSIGFGL